MWNLGGWKFFFVSVAVAALVAAALVPERPPPQVAITYATDARLDALRAERAATARRIPWLLDQHRAEAEATLAELDRRLAVTDERLDAKVVTERMAFQAEYDQTIAELQKARSPSEKAALEGKLTELKKRHAVYRDRMKAAQKPKAPTLAPGIELCPPGQPIC